MDANGTRFHLLLGRDDFGRRGSTRASSGINVSLADAFTASAHGADAAFSWDTPRAEMTLGKRVFYFTPAPGNVPVSLDDRRGAAFDVHGNTYWIAGSGVEILVQSSGSRRTSHFWSSLDDPRDPACLAVPAGGFAPIPSDTPARPIDLSGLAVTALHYLVVGTLDPAGLLVFDLHRGGEPRQLLWPPSIPFEPFDLAATHDGGVLVLDRANGRLWGLDQTLGVVSLSGMTAAPGTSAQFEPLDGSSAAAPFCRPVISADLSIAVGTPHFVAVDALPDGSVLLLENDPAERFSRVHRFRPGPTPGSLVAAGPAASASGALTLVEESQRDTFSLHAHDMLVSHRDGVDVLYLATAEGDQVFAFELAYDDATLTLTPIAEVFPMRLFGGRGLIAGPGAQPHYDSTNIWVPLASLRKPRFAAAGTFVVDLLDGKTPDCVWHRLVFDAHVPPGCEIEVRSRARNDASELPFAEWQPELSPIRRAAGTELPWTDEAWRAGLDTLELLFQHAKGRYLQLEITLRGTTRCSPRLRAIRIWYPRFSYLERYLPAVYRENAESASFLDRFLANPEGIFTEIEGRIAGAQALLDYRTAPSDALEWLASWFHVALDPAWDEDHRRLFIRHAAEFFEWRGTIPGLRMALRLATERCATDGTFSLRARRTETVKIIERFRTRPLPGAVFVETSPADGLPLRTTRVKWDPSLGAADLHRRWAELVGDPLATFPIAAPGNAAERTQWSAFALEHLGFVPAAGDIERWRAMLQRRHPTLDHLNRAWETTHTTWDTVTLPGTLPAKPGALRDWIHFQSLVLPAVTTAHRFTVLLPQGTLGMKEREQRLDLVRRVVALEKPAHTSFDVKFYWAFFRIGEARLGEGTIVDLGSRSPELLGPFVLDRHYLGSGYLASAHIPRSSRSCGCASSTRGEQQ